VILNQDSYFEILSDNNTPENLDSINNRLSDIVRQHPNLGLNISSLQNSLSSIIPQTRNYDIEPISDMEKIVKEEEAIILFELIPIEELEKINEYFKEKFGDDLLKIENRIEQRIYQNSFHSIEINLALSSYVKKTLVYASYNFGKYFQLIFFCTIKIDDLLHTGQDSEKIISERCLKINEIQKEIEGNIPDILHGFFMKNNFNSFEKPFELPSLILFNSSQFSHFLEKRTGLLTSASIFEDLNTERDWADIFLHNFKKDAFSDDPENHLEKLGIYPFLLMAILDKSLIISVDDQHFIHLMGKFPCRFVGLHFSQNSDIAKDQILIDFVYDLALAISIDGILTKLRIDLENANSPKLSNPKNETELKFQKQKAFTHKNDVESIEELYLLYQDAIKDSEERNVLAFINEETWKTGGLAAGKDARSISDYFEDLREFKFDDLENRISYKKERVEDQLEFINSELSLIKDRPAINSFLKDVEDELVTQIIKWRGKIPEKNIQEWLLNFNTTEDRKIALKILDKISYVTYNDLKSLCKNLFNRIIEHLGDSYDDCYFSFIGKITSGSAHIQKLFQEQNKIPESKFLPIDKLPKSSKLSPLILLDDFIGSGQTFTKWFKDSGNIKPILDKNYQILYCVLTAFENGKTKIETESKVPVLSGYLYEKNQQARDGDIFSSEDNTQIKKLVEKYPTKISNFSWGYDDCQLLVAFEGNIPNNSLAILWSDKGWTPLIERK